MKCKNCGAGIKGVMLHRTKPKGQTDAGWMCMPCIESTEPELAKNIKSDCDDAPILNDLSNIFYNKPIN